MSHTPPPGIPTTDNDSTIETTPVAAPWSVKLSGREVNLTPREREVADMLCRGFKNAEIAKATGISIKTVDTHRGHVLSKLEIRNNVELLRLAITHGWHRVEASS